jgi:HEAT repeat protein
MNRLAILPLLLLAACSGAPDAKDQTKGEFDPSVEKDFQQVEANAKRDRELPRILLQIDKALSGYAAALDQKGASTADRRAESLDRLLARLVRENQSELLATATDSSVVANQGIALSALGFAEGKEVMPVLLGGAQSTDPFLVDRAIFGLAILMDPATPVGVIIKVVDDPKHRLEGRASAAWALYRLQAVTFEKEKLVAFWKQLAARPRTEVEPSILLQAIRGLGLTREPTDAALVANHLDHPTPKVREACAVALGRMNAQDQVSKLIDMLTPVETNPNVRLAARKALQALSGGADRGYEVDEWRKIFERGD